MPATGERSNRDEIERELATLERELAFYAKAIASVEPLDSILAEIKEREARKATLKAKRASLANLAA